MIRTPEGKLLHGDWRHRRGSKTDAHLWSGTGHHPYDQLPICGKRIRHYSTTAVHVGRPCTDCLVAAITERDYSHV